MDFGKQELFRIKHIKKVKKGLLNFCLVLNTGKLFSKAIPACFPRKGHVRVKDRSGFLIPGIQSLCRLNPGS